MKTYNKLTKNFILTLLVVPIILVAHGDNTHKKDATVKQVLNKKSSLVKEYKSINTAYLKDIKPIFKKKCFDCHGIAETKPWYYSVPVVKQIIDYDIKEAKKHIDMSKDFPFVSHETPLKDLKSLKEVIQESEMPPFRYILGHWDSRLTEAEQKIILKWSENSIQKINKAD